MPFFYAKGKEKTELLAKYLDRKIENLDDLGCPRVENLFSKIIQVPINIYPIITPEIIVP